MLTTISEPPPRRLSRTGFSCIAPFTAFKYYDVAKPLTFLPATTLVSPVVANKQFLKSLGPDLEKMVREEFRKHETLFVEWNLNNIKNGEEIWRKNGGEIITLPEAEAKRYLELVSPTAAQVLSVNPKIKEDYEAFLAAAKAAR